MNARKLAKLGVPQDCVSRAIQVVQVIAKHNHSAPKDQRIDAEEAIRACVQNPDLYLEQTEPESATGASWRT